MWWEGRERRQRAVPPRLSSWGATLAQQGTTVRSCCPALTRAGLGHGSRGVALRLVIPLGDALPEGRARGRRLGSGGTPGGAAAGHGPAVRSVCPIGWPDPGGAVQLLLGHWGGARREGEAGQGAPAGCAPHRAGQRSVHAWLNWPNCNLLARSCEALLGVACSPTSANPSHWALRSAVLLAPIAPSASAASPACAATAPAHFNLHLPPAASPACHGLAKRECSGSQSGGPTTRREPAHLPPPAAPPPLPGAAASPCAASHPCRRPQGPSGFHVLSCASLHACLPCGAYRSPSACLPPAGTRASSKTTSAT